MSGSRPPISGLPRYALALLAAMALLMQAFLGNAAGGSAMAHGFDPASVLCATGDSGSVPLPGVPHPGDCLCPAACHASTAQAFTIGAPPAALLPRFAAGFAYRSVAPGLLVPGQAPASSARGPPLQA